MKRAEERLRATALGVALCRALDLLRRDDGAAMVTTLAMFLLMYLACVGVYAVSTAVRERVHLQNAADAAAYSAAVVQADTMSRVATVNRAMAWTYEQMTRRQLDYIVHRWLDHTLEHFEQDKRKARSFHSCSGRCLRGHKYPPKGWFIGSHDRHDHIQLNGIDSPHLGLTPMTSESGLLNLGSLVPSSTIKSMLSVEDAKIGASLLNSDVWAGESATISAVAAALRSESLYPSKSNSDTFASVDRMVSEIDGPKGEAVADSGVMKALKRQILSDRLNIAAMNVASRNLVHDMPKRIERAVKEIVRSNVPPEMEADCLWYVRQNENPLANEEVYDPSASIPGGYFENLHNFTRDERRFMRFAGFDGTPVEEHNSSDYLCSLVAGGVEQWFVRGNGWRRTDGGVGLQRSYKHWAEGARSGSHAAPSPEGPSCYNDTKLQGSPRSFALHSSWEWHSGKWFCIDYDGVLVHVHFHLGYTFLDDCAHGGSEKSLVGQPIALAKAALGLADLPGFVAGALGGVSSPGDGDASVPAKDPNDLGSTSSPVESYKDGCRIYLDLLRMAESSGETLILPWRGYSRLYGDAPHLYNSAYVGERAKPLVLKRNYFGRDGTITVGVARRNRNVWERILGSIEGVFKAFDPDWNGEGAATWTWAFASAKAGYKPKGEDDGSRRYRVDWRSGDDEWNMCRSDWDAVFVPVSKADALAVDGAWLGGGGSVMADAVADTGGWKPVASGGGAGDWLRVRAPEGVEGGGELDWKGLGGVTYH